MAVRRVAIVVTALLLAIVTPACKFSRSTNTAVDKSETTESSVDVIGDLTTLPDDSTTTTAADTTTTSRHVTTTIHTTATTAKPATRVATTARPAAPATPHCTVSVPDSYYGGDWTANVSSTFPNSSVTVDLKWSGGSGNYSGVTDGSGSWVKTQRVQPSMRAQRVSVTAAVGGRTCSTSFMVS